MAGWRLTPGKGNGCWDSVPGNGADKKQPQRNEAVTMGLWHRGPDQSPAFRAKAQGQQWWLEAKLQNVQHSEPLCLSSGWNLEIGKMKASWGSSSPGAWEWGNNRNQKPIRPDSIYTSVIAVTLGKVGTSQIKFMTGTDHYMKGPEMKMKLAKRGTILCVFKILMEKNLQRKDWRCKFAWAHEIKEISILGTRQKQL